MLREYSAAVDLSYVLGKRDPDQPCFYVLFGLLADRPSEAHGFICHRCGARVLPSSIL